MSGARELAHVVDSLVHVSRRVGSVSFRHRCRGSSKEARRIQRARDFHHGHPFTRKRIALPLQRSPGASALTQTPQGPPLAPNGEQSDTLALAQPTVAIANNSLAKGGGERAQGGDKRTQGGGKAGTGRGQAGAGRGQAGRGRRHAGNPHSA